MNAWRMIGLAITAIGTLAAIYCLRWAVWAATNDPQHQQATARMIIAVWAIVPPVWFLLEYLFLYPKSGRDFNEFKYGQDLSKAVWLAVGAAFYAIYLKEMK
jgi:hypothetical protein